MQLLTVFRNYLDHTSRVVHLSTTNCAVSETATKACPQGSVMEPVHGHLPCMLKISYADDIVVVVAAPNRRERLHEATTI